MRLAKQVPEERQSATFSVDAGHSGLPGHPQ